MLPPCSCYGKIEMHDFGLCCGEVTHMLRSDRHSRRRLSGATGRKSTLIQMLMIDD